MLKFSSLGDFVSSLFSHLLLMLAMLSGIKNVHAAIFFVTFNCISTQNTSEGSKSSTHYLGDKNRFDVSSKGPSSGRAPTNGPCSKRRICFYRLGSE